MDPEKSQYNYYAKPVPGSPQRVTLTRREHEEQASSSNHGRGSFSLTNFPEDRKRTNSIVTTNIPDFFSPAVFRTVLHNPTISYQLLKFGESRLCGESIEFLTRVQRYQALLQQVSQQITEIHDDFLTEGRLQLNLDERVLIQVNSEVKAALASTMPRLESIFGTAQTDTEKLVFGDVYPAFVRHQLALSAARALGTNRARYAGLGDCFVLTDPAKADNPIVFASDGFVQVTGYSRTEIIPRNCRFLQGSSTDIAVVKRIKAAIEKREESVELLLNRRKNGEPFWNLLYVTPLFDSRGKVVFFLGGQINCSTTIHSTSDVLRILAESRDIDQDVGKPAADQQREQVSKNRGFMGPFRGGQSKSNSQQAVPGMENGMLKRLESMPVLSQIRTFYTAYSHFIVVNYSTFLIAFISTGIVDLLFPIKAKPEETGFAVGADIFKFLSNHGSGSVSWDFKASVKSALKAGNAISLDLKLCAKPYMGFERFALHWTPLKDEKGAVTWVVLTMGNEKRA